MELLSNQEKEITSAPPRPTPYTSNNNNNNIICRGSGGGERRVPPLFLDPDAAIDADSDSGVRSNIITPNAKTASAAPFLKAATTTTRYLECLRNHAASVGGNVLDGCREFMQSGEDGTSEALKCAACSCHRNFHRKTVEGETRILQLPAPPLPSHRVLKIPPPAGNSYHFSAAAAQAAQPMAVAFGGAESSSEDANAVVVAAPHGTPQSYGGGSSKKRFRTKFTQEQKEKMMEFAEKMGWRIQNRNEAEIQKFCAEVGVRRQVFKVWMHNNKNTVKQQMKQQQQQQQQPQPSEHHHHHHHHHPQQQQM